MFKKNQTKHERDFLRTNSAPHTMIFDKKYNNTVRGKTIKKKQPVEVMIKERCRNSAPESIIEVYLEKTQVIFFEK